MMARLVAICRGGEEEYPFLARQIPLYIDDSLTMVMEFPDSVAVDSNDINSPSFKQFSQYYSKLTHQDLNIALMVTSREVYSALSQFVPCVGCRRSVERLFSHLVESGSPALEPLTVKSTGMLSITKSCISDFKKLYTLFYIHGSKLNDLIDAIPKSKKNKRCQLHSLDTHKPRPLGGGWMDVWELMSQECRDEVVVIDSACLLETLEEYLRKHKFCADCKNKVLRAYNILVGDLDGSKEKGYCAALFEGLCCCPHERHIHVYCETDFIAHLLGRAEPEFSGGYERRERHAKTIDIAQEEVLTCIGIHLYERLHRIWQKLRAEEQTWQVLFHLGIDALRKSFEIAVEKFEGISRLEQFFEELSEEERAKELKLEKKRQKKKNRRKNKCGNEMAEQEADNEKRVPDVGSVESVESCCQGCESHYEDENICQDPITANENMSCRCSSNTKQDLSTHSNGSDCGYSSSSEICSREGSDVACSDGICNHDEGGDNNIHICSEDGTDCCLDCWHKEDQCTNKKGKSSDLCNNEGHNDEQLLHLRPTKETLPCGNTLANNTLHCPWIAHKQDPGFKITLLELQESKVYSNEENGLTKEEIQSFFEKYPTFLQERHLFRQRIKKRFFDYCHAATRRKVVGHS
ncbi:gametogenetin-binding protein 2 [Periophthalmus magnuspinnatus]|uniref:gametogenetin-binding protein 2 n=1 Tax=Periophthalmus magnuspinnatus TaxID=409849 RepID=UPI00145B9546|nr:gametogenetin-binding protein 2 [Periophthalmus magnuspinnatus]XP_055082713.1 gametogenetin-binding protein 2 [Periophthalmus magnuspinnatus]